MNKVNLLIDEVIKKNAPLDCEHFFPGASQQKIKRFISACEANFGMFPPQDYLEFLKIHDGFVSDGVFLYSSSVRFTRYSGELSFVEINRFHRDFLGDDFFEHEYCLYFGDSDMDYYVLDLKNNRYQIRERQASETIVEEFNTFNELLEAMLKRVLSRE